VDDETLTIAGYPLVRALRRDDRREVWVGADASGAGVEVHRARPGEDAALAREAEALLAADHPHLLPVLDVAADAGAVLVRPLVPHDLAAWLVERSAPRPGEAVTALAPVASALAALHALGASAGGCDAHDVRLDGDGAPMLLAEGAAIETERPTLAWREGSDGVAADVASWRALADAVLGAAGERLPTEVEHALEHHDLAAASAALLAAWSALPLALEAAAAPDAAAPVPGRMRRRERPAGLDRVLSRVALVAERAVERAGPLLPSAVAAVTRVRPRFWAIAGCGGAAMLAAALLLAPQGDDAGAAGLAPEPAASQPGVEAAVEAEAEASEHPTEPAEGSEADGAADPSVGEATEESTSGVEDADPVEAAAAVLAEREACLDAGDAACLVLLHEPGSPQLDTAEPWRMPDDGRLEVVQRLGDAWLLRVVSETAPASVLVMSTEAGWTLRDAWLT
jgi:eukaryotic-like serine/threonine-protein kinase